MNILVTGAAGYLGSVLVPRLLQEGFSVTALDNFMYRQTSLLDCCWNGNLRITRGDACNASTVKELLTDVDVIIPLACITGAPACAANPEKASAVNIEAVRMLNRLRSRDQAVVFPTTNSGYGIGRDGIYCTEETPLNPVSLYGRLKVEAEKVLLDSGNAVTLRLATVFGISPRMRLDLLVNDFTYRAVNDGFLVLFQAHFKRNYVHIRDVAGAFIHSIRNFDIMKDQPYNVGLDDANLSKLELCREIKRKIPRFYFTEAEIGEDPDKRNYIVSNKKLADKGFKASVSIQSGIAELIRGYSIIRENSYSNI